MFEHSQRGNIMKILKFLTSLLVPTTLALPTVAFADPYVGVKIGQSSLHGTVNQFQTTELNKNRNSANFGIVAGYEVSKNLALESTFEHIGGLKVKRADVDVLKHSARAFTFVIKPKVEIAENTNLYAKVGSAAVRNDVKTLNGSYHRLKPSVVAGAGLEHKISDNVRISLDYQFIDKVAKIRNSVNYRPDSHAVSAQVSWYFSGLNNDVVKPKTIQLSQPLQPINVEKTVYFNFDSARLTNAAKSEIKALSDIQNAKSIKTWKVQGYADQLGSDAYNLKLSEKRAKAVAKELSKHSNAEIIQQGNGELKSEMCNGLAGKKLKTCLSEDRKVVISTM